MTKKELQERLDREHSFSRSLWNEVQILNKKFYEPLSKDEVVKENAIRFAKFLFTMNVRCVDYEKQLYKTNTGLAPDMLTESLEEMYKRHMESKVQFGELLK